MELKATTSHRLDGSTNCARGLSFAEQRATWKKCLEEGRGHVATLEAGDTWKRVETDRVGQDMAGEGGGTPTF